MKKLLLIVWLSLIFPQAVLAQTLNLFTWSEYIPQTVLNNFTKETGIKVALATYESNEAMFTKLKLLQGEGYDLIIPSSYLVKTLKDNDLLAPIDATKIKGLENIDPNYLHRPFDPKNEYTIPYMTGYLGILVNEKLVVPSTITSWKDLARPEFKGKLLLSDDLRDIMDLGLRAQGYAQNSRQESELEAAYDWLKSLKPSVRIFDITATKQAFVSEEVQIGIAWNGDAYIAQQENPKLHFIIPQEGLMLWLDSFAILKNAANKDAAHTFINYMLRPEVAKLCVEEFNYSTPNKATLELLDPALRHNPIIVPPAAEVAKATLADDLGEFRARYEYYFEKLKALD